MKQTSILTVNQFGVFLSNVCFLFLVQYFWLILTDDRFARCRASSISIVITITIIITIIIIIKIKN